MGLRLNIEDKYKEAIKNKNTQEINTLRLIKSAIKDKDIASRTSDKQEPIDDSEILNLLQNLIKQRKDSINSFKEANRQDLIEIEENEIKIISYFLPKQLSENEIEDLVISIIDKKNFSSIKHMGQLMNEIKSNYSGSIDMALAGKISKTKLSD